MGYTGCERSWLAINDCYFMSGPCKLICGRDAYHPRTQHCDCHESSYSLCDNPVRSVFKLWSAPSSRPIPRRHRLAFDHSEIRNFSDRKASEAIWSVGLRINDWRRRGHDIRDQVAGARADTKAVAAEARGQYQAGEG